EDRRRRRRQRRGLGDAGRRLVLRPQRQDHRRRPGESRRLDRAGDEQRIPASPDRARAELRAADALRRVRLHHRVSLEVARLSMSHYLSLILFTPLVGAVLLLFVSKQNANAIRWIANVVALIGFAISVPLWFWYNPANADFQFVERAPWIPTVGAEYFLGVDGLSVLLILLTTMMGFIATLSSWTAIEERVKEYYIFLLVLQTGML